MTGVTSMKQQAPSAAGTKRKRGLDAVKYYAVRIGRRPGVYSTWADCFAQVNGFKKATFKSFPSINEAESYVAGSGGLAPQQTAASKMISGSLHSAPKFYAVKNGRSTGIFTSWAQAEKQISAWPSAQHRSFMTRSEAQSYLDDGKTQGAGGGAIQKKIKTSSSKASKAFAAQAESLKEEDYAPGTMPLPPDTFDGFDPNIILDPNTDDLVYKTPEQRGATRIVRKGSKAAPIRVHTDGSALGNGKIGAFAGIGVYFGPHDQRNVSEALSGTKQTNQRAELTAILRALDIVPKSRDIIVVTDSRYAIDCITNWSVNWRKNGWRTSAGKAVENRDLIEQILSKIDVKTQHGAGANFEWVKGHAANDGNVQADKLAVDAATRKKSIT